MLLRPEWPSPLPLRRFMQNIGVVVNRRREDVRDSPGDDVFCTADRAFVLPTKRFRVQIDGDDAQALFLKCAFRRFFSDGTALHRFELGLSTQRGANEIILRSLLEITHELLAQTVTVGRRGNPCTLGLAGSRLAKLFVRATQARKGVKIAPSESGVQEGRPLLLVCTSEASAPALAGLSELTWIDPQPNWPRVLVGNVQVANENWRFVILVGGEAEAVRGARLSITRLHAEIEAVRAISAQVVSGRLHYDPTGPSGERISAFFDHAGEILFQHRFYGIPLRPIFSALLESDKVSGVMKTGSTSDLTSRATKQIEIAVNLNRRIEMNSIRIQQAPGSSVGDVVIAKTIQDSFNKISNEKRPDLKQLLEELHKTSTQAIAALPVAERKAAAANLDRLVDESRREVPDKKFWEISRDGLLEATKTIAEIAPTLITVAGSIAAFLFK